MSSIRLPSLTTHHQSSLTTIRGRTKRLNPEDFQYFFQAIRTRQAEAPINIDFRQEIPTLREEKKNVIMELTIHINIKQGKQDLEDIDYLQALDAEIMTGLTELGIFGPITICLEQQNLFETTNRAGTTFFKVKASIVFEGLTLKDIR